MTDADAWLWPAVLLLMGYTLYYLAYGVGGARWQTTWLMAMVQSSTAGGDAVAARSVTAFMAWLAPASQLFGNVVQVPLAVALSWGMRTLLFYGLARLLGGGRPLRGHVVAMVGWAWTPLFLQYALTGILMLAFPRVMAFFLPLPDAAGMGRAAESMRHNWHGQMLFYLSPLVFWNLALCVVGVAELFRLPRWKAVIVVLVPAVAQLVFMMAGFFLSAAMLQAFPEVPPPSSPPR